MGVIATELKVAVTGREILGSLQRRAADVDQEVERNGLDLQFSEGESHPHHVFILLSHPDDVLRALADLDAGTEHSFGQPTGYELLHEGRRYAPKAVVGLACRYSLGRVLLPEEFSGGEAPGQANYVLRRLGFTVIKKGEGLTDENDAQQPGSDWSENEVQLVVADYFGMLQAELHGQDYNKAAHRKLLNRSLPVRSKGSIEFKHQNISAVLVNLGLPYIDGYKPRGNFQGLLADAVENFLELNPNILPELSSAPVVSPQRPSLILPDLGSVIEAPPDEMPTPTGREKPWLTRRGRRIDFAEVDARNRHLAKLGEEFVVEVERHRLLGLGRDDLARKVQWVAKTIGDGLGFDILSFDDTNDAERFLEVKTTGLGKFFPFYVSINEVNCSQDVPDKYHLYRVFDFSRSPRLYILRSKLGRKLHFAASTERLCVSALGTLFRWNRSKD